MIPGLGSGRRGPAPAEPPPPRFLYLDDTAGFYAAHAAVHHYSNLRFLMVPVFFTLSIGIVLALSQFDPCSVAGAIWLFQALGIVTAGCFVFLELLVTAYIRHAVDFCRNRAVDSHYASDGGMRWTGTWFGWRGYTPLRHLATLVFLGVYVAFVAFWWWLPGGLSFEACEDVAVVTLCDLSAIARLCPVTPVP